MIEEELYQRASDELNSDRRDPKLWARACALASDDHDEARYLYTNLRVEQLQNEHQTDSVSTAAPMDPPPATASVTTAAMLADPLPDTPDSLDLLDDPAMTHDGTGEHQTGEPLALDARLEPATALRDAPFPESRRAPEASDDDVAELDRPVKDTSPGGRPIGSTSSDDLDWLDDAVVEADAPVVERPVETTSPLLADRMLSTLEQTAHRAETDASLAGLATATPERADRSAAHAPDTSLLDQLRPDDAPAAGTNAGATVAAFGSGMRDDYADTRDLDALLDDDIEAGESGAGEIEVAGGRGGRWAVYETGVGSYKAVRRGVSWGALFLTLPWLLARGLLGTAIAYVLLWAVSLGGLLLTGLAWMDAGDSAPDLLKLACAGFALIVFIGLFVVPFFRANRWRETGFKRRGYTMRAKVRARNGNEAIGRMQAHT